MRTFEVTDPADPRIAVYATIRDGEIGGLARAQRDLFVVEGRNPVAEIVTSPYELVSLLVEENRLEMAEELLDGLDVPVYVADRSTFRAIVRFRLHHGIVGAGRRLPPVAPSDALRGARLVAAFEAINDHENLGVVFRSARALGVDAVALGPQCCDPLYRRCVRVSMGHALHVPITTTSEWPDGVEELRAAGLRTVALALREDAVSIDDLDPDVPTALLLGAEGPGLTDAAIDAADVVARIPMAASVDSLNVGVAASLAFHELTRTRSERR